MVSLHLSVIRLFNRFFGKIPSVRVNSPVLLERFRDFKGSIYFSVCFSKSFPKGEYISLSCSIICPRLQVKL